MLISIFFIILMLAMAVIAIGGSIIRSILNILFGRRVPFGHHSTHGNRNQMHDNSHKSTPNNSQQSSEKRRKKIFDDSEGEYVDFEEIRD